MARSVKPLATPRPVPPPFKMNAFGVFARKQIGLTRRIICVTARTRHMRLAARLKLGLIGHHTAIGTFQN
jgi:hypothetical protein